MCVLTKFCKSKFCIQVAGAHVDIVNITKKFSNKYFCFQIWRKATKKSYNRNNVCFFFRFVFHTTVCPFDIWSKRQFANSDCRHRQTSSESEDNFKTEMSFCEMTKKSKTFQMKLSSKFLLMILLFQFFLNSRYERCFCLIIWSKFYTFLRWNKVKFSFQTFFLFKIWVDNRLLWYYKS